MFKHTTKTITSFATTAFKTVDETLRNRTREQTEKSLLKNPQQEFYTKADLPTIFNDIQTHLLMNPIGMNSYWSVLAFPNCNQIVGHLDYEESTAGMHNIVCHTSITLHLAFTGTPDGTSVTVDHTWRTSMPWNLLDGGLGGPGKRYIQVTNMWIKTLCERHQ